MSTSLTLAPLVEKARTEHRAGASFVHRALLGHVGVDAMTGGRNVNRQGFVGDSPSTTVADVARAQRASDRHALRVLERWISRQRPSLIRDYRQQLATYVPPHLGHLSLTRLRATDLIKLRPTLLERSLDLKTVRNVIDGSFRAVMREARTVDLLLTDNPFSNLR